MCGDIVEISFPVLNSINAPEASSVTIGALHIENLDLVVLPGLPPLDPGLDSL